MLGEINKVHSSHNFHYVDPYRVAIILKSLPNNKSPGIKGIKNEFYKYGYNTDLPHSQIPPANHQQ